MGFEGVEVVEGAHGAEGLRWLLYIFIYCEMVRTPFGIGYIALWGFGAKCGLDRRMEWIPLRLL